MYSRANIFHLPNVPWHQGILNVQVFQHRTLKVSVDFVLPALHQEELGASCGYRVKKNKPSGMFGL